MRDLNKTCATLAIVILALVGFTPYIIDGAFGTHLVAKLNQDAQQRR